VQTNEWLGAESEELDYVLNALGDQKYLDTLSALQNGETLTNGSNGSAAAGLQQMLVDFGCSISIDGDAGPATFAALNDVLAAFNMESAQAVDADLYAQLLPLLLLSRDEAVARDLLYDSITSEDEGRFDYLLGCARFLKGHYYTAKLAFLESEYEDYLQRAEACVQPWPQNGELWHDDRYYSQALYLDFDIESTDESQGRCIQVYTEDNQPVCALFLTGSGTVSTTLPEGVYRFRDALGFDWYGVKEAFGEDGEYEEYIFYDQEYNGDPSLVYLNAGYQWIVSVRYYGDYTTGVGTVETNWDSWVTE